MLTTIKLWGELGEKFTPEIQADVSTVKDAIACVQCNFPDFKNYILNDKKHGYSVVVRSDNWELPITEENKSVAALLPIQGKEIVITPHIQGSGSGIFQAIGLIGIGLVTGGTGFVIAGIAMGLQSIFFGNPESPRQDEKGSLFQSPGFTTAEGTPVPIICGEVLLKSTQSLSIEIVTEYTSI